MTLLKYDDLRHKPKAVKAALEKAAVAQFWERGHLRYKTFPGGQRQLYDRVHQQPELFPGTAEPLVALCHRRFGKSHMSALLCVERCLSQPGIEVHFGTDTKNHARQIIEGKLFETFKDMPSFISHRTRDNCYWFRNEHWPRGAESMLVLEGLDFNLGGQVRGGSADLFVIDEVREIRNLEYVMKHVITPMFKGRKNPTLLMCSTPPDSMDHPFCRYVDRATATEPSSLITIKASTNPDWTEEDTKLMMGEYSGPDDMGWRRELECEMIPDTSRVIIPEWDYVSDEIIINPLQRPAHYTAYVTLDMGWKDHSAALFAYYDFNRDKIVVIDELFVKYTPTEDFAELLWEKIQKNFPPYIRENLRVMGDGNALNLADLNRALSKICEVRVSEVDKYDRDAAINNMRSGIQAKKILFQSNCDDTIYQCKNGTWNKKRSDFDRSEKMGHCDLLACLRYLYKQMRWGENVQPNTYEAWQQGVFHNPYAPVQVRERYINEKEETIGKIFGQKRFIQRRRRFG